MVYIWMKVTDDKYELPVLIADSAEELASSVGVSPNTIYSAICHAEQRKRHSIYQRIKLKEGEI